MKEPIAIAYQAAGSMDLYLRQHEAATLAEKALRTNPELTFRAREGLTTPGPWLPESSSRGSRVQNRYR